MTPSFFLSLCLLACNVLSIHGSDSDESNSIATNTLLLQSDCHGECEGYDACVIYDIDSDNPCNGNDESEDTSDNADTWSACQEVKEDLDHQYQCFTVFSRSNSSVSKIFSFVITSKHTAKEFEQDGPHLDDKYLDAIDLRLDSSVDALSLCGNDCTYRSDQNPARVKVSNNTLSLGLNVESAYFNNIDFSQDVPSFVNTSSQLKRLVMTNCRLKEVPDISQATYLERLDLNGNNITNYPAKMAINNLRQLYLKDNDLETFEGEFTNLQYLHLGNNSFESIPEAIADMPNLRELHISYNPLTDRTVSPALYEKLNTTTYEISSDFQNDAPDCPDGEIQNISFTDLEVCVSDKATLSQDDKNDTTSSPATTDPATEELNDTDTEEEGGMSSATVIYIVVPIIVVVVFAGIFLCFYLKRRKRDSPTNTRSLSYVEVSSPISQAGKGGNEEAKYSIWNDQQLANIQLNVDDIRDVRKLGGGAFGIVYLVEYRNDFYASKRLRESKRNAEEIQNFIEEIKLVATLEHPNIVTLVGAAWTKRSDFQALFEYMENGDLRSYLQGASSRPGWSDEKFHIGFDIIKALVYVHSFIPPLLHRDLKSLNVLLSASMVAKLSDFGTAREHDIKTMTVEGVGTVRWLAPEILRGDGHYTEACDVYSFGVILTELSTHELPYYDLVRDDSHAGSVLSLANRISSGSIRPSVAESCPKSIRSLADKCLSNSPEDRPTAAQIQYYFHEMTKQGSSRSDPAFK